MSRTLGFVKSPLLSRALDAPDDEVQELVVVCFAVLSAQARERLLESGRLGRVFDQRHAHQQPATISSRCCATSRTPSSPSSSTRGRRGAGVPAAAIVAATEEILIDNGVRAQGSPDTLAVWQGKPAP